MTANPIKNIDTPGTFEITPSSANETTKDPHIIKEIIGTTMKVKAAIDNNFVYFVNDLSLDRNDHFFFAKKNSKFLGFPLILVSTKKDENNETNVNIPISRPK